MYYLRLSVRHWFVTAGPGVRFQQTVRDSQRTADIYISLHKHTSSTAVSRRRATTVSTLFSWGYTNPAVSPPLTGSQPHIITASEVYLAAHLRSHHMKGHAGYDTQAAGWCVHLGLPLIRWQRSGADRWRPRGEEDKLRGGGLKRRSIMWSRGIISSLEMYFYSEWLCYGDIF